jgi:hypothetical protein
MTDKPKNDNRNLLHRNALIVSMGLNVVLIVMLLILYMPTLLVPTQLISVQQTATYISTSLIAQTPTFTPISIEDEVNLRERYLSEFETGLGFAHPVLEETINGLIQGLKTEVQLINQRGYGDNPIPENIIYSIDRTSFAGTEYIALVTWHWGDGMISLQGLIFGATIDSVELFARTPETTWLEGFEDRNNNGFPDVAFHFGRDVVPASFGINVYEVRSNSEFVNLTENLNVMLSEFVDLDSDGIMEIVGFQRYFVPEGAADQYRFYSDGIVPRWFRWNGEAYEALPLIEGE